MTVQSSASLSSPPTQANTFCFVCLALGEKYRQLAKILASDFQQFAPACTLVVGTDVPSDFDRCSNVKAFKLISRGILHCYHDKRFVLEQGLSEFETVILIDADTRLTAPLPEHIKAEPGVYGRFTTDLIKHSQRYNPARLKHFRRLAEKLNFVLEDATFVGEALFSVTASPSQAKVFFTQWDKMARYLELNGVHAGEGNVIGMAALQARLPIRSADWLTQIDNARKHLDVSQQRRAPSPIEQFQKRLRYHFRLNRARLFALGDFRFFYK